MNGSVCATLLILATLAYSDALTCYFCEKWTVNGTETLSETTGCLNPETTITCHEGEVCVEGNSVHKYFADFDEHEHEYYKDCDLTCEQRGAADYGLFSEIQCNEKVCDTDLCNTMTMEEARLYHGEDENVNDGEDEDSDENVNDGGDEDSDENVNNGGDEDSDKNANEDSHQSQDVGEEPIGNEGEDNLGENQDAEGNAGEDRDDGGDMDYIVDEEGDISEVSSKDCAPSAVLSSVLVLQALIVLFVENAQ